MKRHLLHFSTAGLLLTLGATACPSERGSPPSRGDDDDSSSADDDDSSSADDDDDAGESDPDLDATGVVTGNFGCAEVAPPPPGATGEVALTLRDFQDDVAVPSAIVEIWPGNNAGRTPIAWTGVTDQVGEALVSSGAVRACTLFSARNFTVFEPPETYQTYQYNLVVSGAPPLDLTISSVSFTTYQLMTLALGVTAEEGDGMVTGIFRDCDGEPIGNAEAQVGRLDTGTGVFTRAPDYDMRYFNASGDPDVGQDYTAPGAGVFVALNVPPDAWDLVLWGIPQDGQDCIATDGGSTIRPAGSDLYCLLGSTPLTVQPDSVSMSDVDLKPFPDACYE